jgi:hypothetical protein
MAAGTCLRRSSSTSVRSGLSERTFSPRALIDAAPPRRIPSVRYTTLQRMMTRAEIPGTMIARLLASAGLTIEDLALRTKLSPLDLSIWARSPEPIPGPAQPVVSDVLLHAAARKSRWRGCTWHAAWLRRALDGAPIDEEKYVAHVLSCGTCHWAEDHPPWDPVNQEDVDPRFRLMLITARAIWSLLTDAVRLLQRAVRRVVS